MHTCIIKRDAGVVPEESMDSTTEEALVQHDPLPEASYHPDGNREIRSMVLAALPIPPMPILASRELGDERSFTDNEAKAISSHDLIAHLMNVSCTVVSSQKNADRERIQWKLQEELFARVDAWQLENDPGSEKQLLPPPDFAYSLLAEFTRLYIQSYMPDPSKAQDVRFLPACDIDKGHVVRRKAMEFQKAQDVLYGACQFGDFSNDLSQMEYWELVHHSVRRMLASAQAV